MQMGKVPTVHFSPSRSTLANGERLKAMKRWIAALFSGISATVLGQLNVEWINQGALTEPVQIVDCTLENGSSTQCYQLKFYANAVNDDGPFCPTSIDEVGGLGIYEPGAVGTNVGLSAIDATLLNLIEADGFDIVQDDGTVNINVPGVSGPPAPGVSACLQAQPDDDLELIYLIPVDPQDLATPNTITTVEQLGVSLDGIPFKGNPPPVIGGGPGGGGSDVAMPALDPCGGHHDPGGYYHWHMIANSTNDVLGDLGIDAVSCTSFPQNNTALMGFAMDGHPIYGQFESDGTQPSNLDNCSGHFAPTPEYPSGVYHYHAVEATAPNIPPCLIGASAVNGFTYAFHPNTMAVTTPLGLSASVFPNPSTGQTLNISTTADNVAVFDAMGRPCHNDMHPQRTNSGFQLETRSLTPGVYHIVLTRGASRTSIQFILAD